MLRMVRRVSPESMTRVVGACGSDNVESAGQSARSLTSRTRPEASAWCISARNASGSFEHHKLHGRTYHVGIR